MDEDFLGTVVLYGLVQGNYEGRETFFPAYGQGLNVQRLNNHGPENNIQPHSGGHHK